MRQGTLQVASGEIVLTTEASMARTTRWKVYDPHGELVASWRYVADAAMLVGPYGRDAAIRWSRNASDVQWIEGREAFSARDDVDRAVTTIVKSRDAAVARAIEIAAVARP
jgi:hypothetical protein